MAGYFNREALLEELRRRGVTLQQGTAAPPQQRLEEELGYLQRAREEHARRQPTHEERAAAVRDAEARARQTSASTAAAMRQAGAPTPLQPPRGIPEPAGPIPLPQMGGPAQPGAPQLSPIEAELARRRATGRARTDLAEENRVRSEQSDSLIERGPYPRSYVPPPINAPPVDPRLPNPAAGNRPFSYGGPAGFEGPVVRDVPPGRIGLQQVDPRQPPPIRQPMSDEEAIARSGLARRGQGLAARQAEEAARAQAAAAEEQTRMAGAPPPRQPPLGLPSPAQAIPPQRTGDIFLAPPPAVGRFTSSSPAYREPPAMSVPRESASVPGGARPQPTQAQAQRDLIARTTTSGGAGQDIVLGGAQPEAPDPRRANQPPVADSVGGALKTAASNVIPNALQVTGGRAETLFSPIDTVRGMYGITAGLISQFVPGEQPSEDYIREAARGLYERYGTLENAQRTFENEPVAMALDLAGMRIVGAPRRLAERVREARRQQESEERSTLQEAVRNFLPSLVGVAKDITAPLHSPIETVRSLWGLGKGVAAMVTPGVQSFEDSRENVEALGSYLMDRYGSMEGLRDTIREDPGGLLADIGGLIAGGSGLALKGLSVAGKASNIARAGTRGAASRAVDAARAGRAGEAALSGVQAFGRAIDPTPKVAGVLGRVGSAAASRIGGGLARGVAIGTGRPVSEFDTAYRASRDNTVPERVEAAEQAQRAADAARADLDSARAADRGFLGRQIGRFQRDSPEAARARAVAEEAELAAQEAAGNIRAQPGEVGGKRALRDQMRGNTPLDTVVNDLRTRVDDKGKELAQRFTEEVASSEGNVAPRQPYMGGVMLRTDLGAEGRRGLTAAFRGEPEIVTAIYKGVDDAKKAAAHNAVRLEELRASGVSGASILDMQRATEPIEYIVRSVRNDFIKRARQRNVPEDQIRSEVDLIEDRVRAEVTADAVRDFPDEAAYNKAAKAFGEKQTDLQSQQLREFPERAGDFASDIARRRRLADTSDKLSEAGKKGAESRRRNELAARIADALGPAEGSLLASGAGTTRNVRKVIDAAIKAKERGADVVDYAIRHGKLTGEEIADLWKVKRVLRPPLSARMTGLPVAGRVAKAIVGASARPIARFIGSAAGGALLGGSRRVQRGALRTLGRGFTTIPRAVIRGTRARWQGREGARAGATIGGIQETIRPVPFTTGVRAAADIGRRLRTGSGPIVSRRTRSQIAKDISRAKESALGAAATSGIAAVKRILRDDTTEAQRRMAERMRDRLTTEAAPGPGMPTASRPSKAALMREADRSINVQRVALAVDEAVTKTFKGLDLDPTTARIRANIGRWINDFIRQKPKAYHNIAGMDGLLQRFENATSGAQSSLTSAPAKAALKAAHDALKDELLRQAETTTRGGSQLAPNYAKNLRARDAAKRHLIDAQKSLSATGGQSAVVTLRKILGTTDANARSTPDAVLGRQYLDSLNVPFMQERLAGMGLSDIMPATRGRRAVAGLGAAGALVNPLALSAALSTSPRLMGEMASALGGLSGSRVARLYKSSMSPQHAAKTRALGAAEGVIKDDPRSSLELLAMILAGAGRGVYGVGSGMASILGAGFRGADRATSAVFDQPR